MLYFIRVYFTRSEVHVRIQRVDRGSRPPPPPPLKNHKNKGLPDPLKNHKATKPAYFSTIWILFPLIKKCRQSSGPPLAKNSGSSHAVAQCIGLNNLTPSVTEKKTKVNFTIKLLLCQLGLTRPLPPICSFQKSECIVQLGKIRKIVIQSVRNK